MRLTVKRFADNSHTTLGLLFINDIFQCFTVEDTERTIKIQNKARIPNGVYKIALRKEGEFHAKYLTKYGSMHKGMLCIFNKANWKLENQGMSFQYILIHTGNTHDHTAGCLLVNDAISNATFTGSSSVDAYKELYPIVAEAIERGEEVTIEYIDIETGK